MTEESSNSIAGMSVEFSADYTELDNAGSNAGAIFAAIEEAAASAASGISDSLTSAAESFGSISQAAEDASAGISDSNNMALASYDDLASGANESLATIADEAESAASGMTAFGAAGASGGSDVLEALGEITQSINAFREIFIDLTDSLISSMDGVAFSVKDVQYAVEEMSSVVTGSIEDLSAEFGNLGEQAQSAGDEIESAGEQASSSGSGSFMDLFNRIGFGIMNFQNLWNIAKQGATALFGPAISAQQMATSFNNLMGSTKAAKDELAQLTSFANNATPFKAVDVEQLAAKLLGFHIQAKDVIPDLTAIGDNLSAIGEATPAQMQMVVDIFGKMNNEGKLSVGIMTELSRDGIDAWGALERATGKNQAQLEAMIKQGLFPANDAMNLLTKGIEMNPIYKGQMQQQMGTMGGLLSTLSSVWNTLMVDFGSPIITALQGSLGDLNNMLGSSGFQSFAGSVGQGIVDVFTGIGDAVHYVDNVLHSINFTPFTKAWDGLKSAVSPIIDDFKKLGSVFSEVGTDADPIADILQKIASSGLDTITHLIQGLADALNGLSKNSAVQGFLSTLGESFKQVSSIVGGQLQDDFKTFSGILQNLGQWWQSTMGPAIQQAMPGFEHLGSVIATTVVPSLAKIWAVGQQVARDVMPYLIQAFETIAPIVVKVGGFLADNLGKAIQFLAPYIVQAAQAIGQFASDIASRVAPIIEILWNGIMSGINTILPIWEAMWPTVSGVLKGAWDVIVGIIKVAWALVSGIIKVGLDVLSGNWGQAWKDIKDMFGGIWDGLKTIVKGAWDGIWSLIKGGINFVIGLLNQFIGGIDGIGIDMGNIHVHPNIPKIPTLSTGGFVAPGDVAIAGDPGPNSELVFGGAAGATVLSHAQSMAAMQGTGGGQVIHLHNHVYLDSHELTDQVATTILDMARGHGPVSGGIAA